MARLLLVKRVVFESESGSSDKISLNKRRGEKVKALVVTKAKRSKF